MEKLNKPDYLTIFGMKFKKIVRKLLKIKMTQHANECFKSKNTFKSDFYFFFLSLAGLEKDTCFL